MTDRETLVETTTQLADLDTMSTDELAAKWEELYGKPPRRRHKQHMRKRLAWRIQELAEGGLSRRAKDRIEELAAMEPEG